MQGNTNRNGNVAPDKRRKGSPSSGGQTPQRRAQGQAVQRPQANNGAKRKKRKPSAKVTLFISMGAVALVLLICMLVSFFIGVQSIDVSGTRMSTREEIIAAWGIEEGSGYFSYNTSKAEKKILDSIPCISEVEIDRTILGKVSIKVTEKEAYWYTELFGEYYVLSDSLEVIRRFESQNELAGKGLVRLDFPSVESAVLGRRIEISDGDRDCSFVDDFL